MFPFLRGSQRGRGDKNTFSRTYSPFAGSPETSRNRAVGGQTTGDPDDDDEEENSHITEYRANQPSLRKRPSGLTSYFDGVQGGDDFAADHEDDEDDDDEDDGGEDDGVTTPLLPIFSAAQLDRLPVYNITHAIRIMIVQRCETTLSWDQLRSPQVSQFLVKPVQSQIRTNHFNRATLCALVANCLQFHKEGQQFPANIGVSRTRALISELLAMRLIREFSTRELIDALSYDFDPLQGISPPTTAKANRSGGIASPPDIHAQMVQMKGARVSTIEVAIRAQAKRFLAHPVVVQHLEAIWAGTVVFHSESDSLHRRQSSHEDRNTHRASEYGASHEHSPSALPADAILSRKAHETRTNKRPPPQLLSIRRSVTLYDPRDASLFKLSRLRVPRYRQVVSTLSFATLLGLFLAVLAERSLYITPLEVVFWFWSVGYMLDEVVGFTEQGFGLYLLSFWNAFDLGILLLFATYFVMRIYGIAIIAEQGKHRIAGYAYDVLGTTAILLLPRLFSVLDHYRYFSQLLIAFRLMSQDLIAVMVLIVILCSGFFVAFTLALSDEDTDAKGVAFGLFQIVMVYRGFTPAAWDRWPTFNLLGQTIMGIFLIVCHFVITTVLITVLTNSFMAIVQNAEEEHQFLFAVNTIAMVKSDALFSYVAPSNIIGWILSPLRYIIPFRQYLKFNRTIIKITHFPILLIICGYERFILSKYTYEPTDLIATQPVKHSRPAALSLNKDREIFISAGHRLREPSVIGSHKDRALDEVFRRPYRGSTVRTTAREMELDRGNSTNAVAKWMQVAENEGGASPPLEQPRSVVERLEHRRPPFRRAATSNQRLRNVKSRDFSMTRSMVSEPDVMSTLASRRPFRIIEETILPTSRRPVVPEETDADGDDENNGDSDAAGPAAAESISIMQKSDTPRHDSEDEEFQQGQIRYGNLPLAHLTTDRRIRQQDSGSPGIPKGGSPRQRHTRNASTSTMLYAPQQPLGDDWFATDLKKTRPSTTPNTPPPGKLLAPAVLPGQRTPKAKPTRPRPVLPPRQKTVSTPVQRGLTFLDAARHTHRDPSFNARALDLASEIGDNKWGPSGGLDGGGISGMPASFSEQILREREILQRLQEQRRQSELDEEKGMVNRIVLARMNRLEEGFREVLKEIKDMSSLANSSRRESDVEIGPPFGMLAAAATTSAGLNRGIRLPISRADTSASGSQKEAFLSTTSNKRPIGHIRTRTARKSSKEMKKEADSNENQRQHTPSVITTTTAGDALDEDEKVTTDAQAKHESDHDKRLGTATRPSAPSSGSET